MTNEKTKWAEMTAEQARDLIAIDALYYSGHELWQCKVNQVWKFGTPIDAIAMQHVRRKKDAPNWIARKYEAGHELSYLEAVHYYILNGNSMSGLELLLRGSWHPSDELYPSSGIKYRLAKKKPMVIVNGHTVPKWETKPLGICEAYYMVSLAADKGYIETVWMANNPTLNNGRLKNGAVFKNESDIKQFVAALRDIKDAE